MDAVYILSCVLIATSLGLWIAWTAEIGPLRAILAAACRLGWLVPLVLALTPETSTEELPRTVAAQPVHVLIDDSQSMAAKGPGGSPAGAAVQERVTTRLQAECLRLGCTLKVSRLSEQSEDVARGFTPLADVLDPWLMKTSGDPWILISDGGDQRPTLPFDAKLRGLGRPSKVAQDVPRGLIIGFPSADAMNIWVSQVDVSPFSFESKPLSARVALRRVDPLRGDERIQVQVLDGGQALATANAEFKAGEGEAFVEIPVPPLVRGQHLLQVLALPTASEKTLWDNKAYAHVEVMPNTVGVLHLLGSPSWDGRFLRRYLKAEPKYDLISFFILRDPWDSQQVNERELSLIPFPVERLFREELPNFRVIILQNFTLQQFLLPEFQANLVKFVQGGGGLLFVGGPRALQYADLASSPLRAVLPFTTEIRESSAAAFPPDLEVPREDEGPTGAVSASGPAYDQAMRYRVALAQPDAHRRALANVYDDWEGLGEALTEAGSLRGLHHMERVKFKDDVSTPLLTARTENGAEIPLAVASYPGKGRALWIFSDSFWRLAMTSGEKTSRQVYHRFMEGAMTWLMRQDLKKPLIATNLVAHSISSGGMAWRVSLRGPATRYFRPGSDWRLSVCGVIVPEGAISIDKGGIDQWELSGKIAATLAGGEQCTFDIEGSHAAFGSVKASVAAVVPGILSDAEVGPAPQKLDELAALTGARLVSVPADVEAAAVGWLESTSASGGVALASRFKSSENYFWILERPWFYLLLMLIPLEVLIRRWHLLVATSGRRSARA